MVERFIIPVAALAAAAIVIRKAVANLRTTHTPKRAYGVLQIVAGLLLLTVAVFLIISGRG